jgi:hypothetical protein
MRVLITAGGALAVAAMVSAGCDTSAKDQVGHGAAGKPSSLIGCLTLGDNGQSIILRAENEPQRQGNERPERAASSPNVYRVETDRVDSVDVKSHVNSRVTVTGYVHAVPAHASGDANGNLQRPPTTGANTRTQDNRNDLIDMQVVRVTAVERLGSCQ